MVERDLAKVDVAGSTPVSRSNSLRVCPCVAVVLPDCDVRFNDIAQSV